MQLLNIVFFSCTFHFGDCLPASGNDKICTFVPREETLHNIVDKYLKLYFLNLFKSILLAIRKSVRNSYIF